MTSIVSVGSSPSPILIALLGSALIVPLLGSLGLTVLKWWSTGRTRTPQVIPVVLAISTLSLAALLTYAGEDVYLFTWLPDAGSSSLHLGGLGGWVAVATTASLLVGLMLVSGDRQPPWALLLGALTVANVSFLAGDFLTRYVALEILGLTMAVVPLVERCPHHVHHAKTTFMYLRLGDVGLLIAIMGLMAATGTLSIAHALDMASRLHGAHLRWITGGMLTAVWIKTAAWPTDGWLQVTKDLSSVSGGWLYGLLMPNLGLYLLYRVTPLVSRDPIVSWLALGLSGAGVLIAVVRIMSDLRPWQLAVSVTALLSYGALAAAATGHQTMLAWLLLASTPLRMACWLQSQRAPRLTDLMPRIPTSGIRGKGLTRVTEPIHQGWDIVTHKFVALAAGWAARLHGLATSVVSPHPQSARQSWENALPRAVARSVLGFCRRLQEAHSGQLRRNIQWATLGLLAFLAWMVADAW